MARYENVAFEQKSPHACLFPWKHFDPQSEYFASLLVCFYIWYENKRKRERLVNESVTRVEENNEQCLKNTQGDSHPRSKHESGRRGKYCVCIYVIVVERKKINNPQVILLQIQQICFAHHQKKISKPLFTPVIFDIFNWNWISDLCLFIYYRFCAIPR